MARLQYSPDKSFHRECPMRTLSLIISATLRWTTGNSTASTCRRRVSASKQRTRFVFEAPTRTEMRRRYARCGGTVVGYCHRRNNVAIQQGGALVIAYRDAPTTTHAQTSIVNFPNATVRAEKKSIKHLRDHGRISARTYADDGRGERKHLIRIR